jgi:sterol desaturase/sphingolipid hydroxylase (fatty acid hydroxylase superfamily)
VQLQTGKRVQMQTAIQLEELIHQIRYIISSATLMIMLTIESIVPMYRARNGIRQRFSHALTNAGLTLINAPIGFAFAFLLIYITEASASHRFGLLNRFDLPAAVHWGMAIILFDCWQYWWHRLNHRVHFLWRFHAVHHSDAEMDATSGTRFHTVEIIFAMLTRLAVLPLIGMTVPQLLLYETLALPIIIFHHSNIRLPSKTDRLMRWLIVTPWMHWVHHSRKKEETDSNYSSFLSVWDRLFGSFQLRTDPEKIQLGLDDFNEQEWRRLTGMLAAPFIRRAP